MWKRTAILVILAGFAVLTTGCNWWLQDEPRLPFEGEWMAEQIRLSDGHKRDVFLHFNAEDWTSPGGLQLVTGTISYVHPERDDEFETYELAGEWDGATLEFWFRILLDKRAFACNVSPERLTCSGSSSFGAKFALTGRRTLFGTTITA